MRICFVAPPDNMSGGMRVIALYAEHLAARGHQVTVVWPAPRQPGARERIGRLARGDASALRRRRAAEGFLASGRGFARRTLQTHRPVVDSDVPDGDLVVATWWETAHWVASLSSAKGDKAYFMQDYGAPGQELEKLIPTWRLGLHIITIAEWLRALVLEHAPDARVVVVENGVDLELFRLGPRTMPAEPTVGFVYREELVKGYDTVRDAFVRARRRLPALKLLTYGPRPAGSIEPLQGMIYKERPADAELSGIYAACTAWLFASRREGFGLPLLEALACRTPLIATRAGVAPEVVQRAGGWLIEPDDAAGMAEAIEEVCRLEPERWHALSEAGYRSVSDRGWPAAASAFEAALIGGFGR